MLLGHTICSGQEGTQDVGHNWITGKIPSGAVAIFEPILGIPWNRNHFSYG